MFLTGRWIVPFSGCCIVTLIWKTMSTKLAIYASLNHSTKHLLYVSFSQWRKSYSIIEAYEFLFWLQISVFEADQNPSLRPGAPWKDTILNPEIAQLFFQVQPPVPLFSDLLQTLGRILTKPWWFGNVCGGARSQWEKIQKVSSPGHTGEEILQISPLRGLSHLAKMYKSSPNVQIPCHGEENIIIILCRELLARKKSKNFLARVSRQDKILFFDLRNSRHATNQPDLSYQRVFQEKTQWLNSNPLMVRCHVHRAVLARKA